MYTDYSNRVSPEVIDLLKEMILDEKNINELIPLVENNERDICCVCIQPFEVKDVIKLLPCNNKHIFHKVCIEKWLNSNKACPTCRKEITKAMVKKPKIY
jgi:hypothetical protein